MRILVLSAVLAATIAMSGPAWAETGDENWDRCKDVHNDPDLRIGACTAIIQSGRETTSNLAAAFSNRCTGHIDKREYDLAIEDCDQAISLDPRYAVAFYNRGIAYRSKGQYDHAIQDYDQAISLDPRYAYAFSNRGNAYYYKGQYDRAIQDYDQAISLDPKYAHAFNGRGWANFNLARFSAAARDFEQSLAITASQAYTVLCLHLARARDTQEDAEEFKRNAAKLDLKAWPGPIISFYLKQMTAEQVREAAKSGDEKAQHEQGCDASFYLGEDAVLRQNTAEAGRLLRQAQETCPPDFFGYSGAAAELKRLGE